ncbi:MAG: family 10 glycosylhydrolase [Rhodothermaceae bacterium]|nr:family 10 glycosylhydrolase [Rhodothermaceae bacterium]MYG70117.1 family 10 glycosylhydrolase [Rhodothermaceae bacterium]MYJ43746.1 family 10 glycosylhydrolase [Rhodothermaceae bacterium]
MRHVIAGLILGVALATGGCAQVAPPPKYETRGAWIATVINLDWPARGASSQSQINALRNMLVKLKGAGINMVMFQVRSEADAMYDSPYEPWSYWLTGSQGRAPDPFYDPLELAIEEAHALGMELHAWFNPYRANRGSNYTTHASHVTNTHPEWMIHAGRYTLLDPGRQAVRDYNVSIIMDVARRYDVDGVHIDDYFYPYPPDNISRTNADSVTFREESRGFTNIGDWRRDNVNLYIQQVADSLRAYDSTIKWGVSPFGIWRNGTPSGIVGLDAYSTIYADATSWIDDASIDYLVPQLYWQFGGGQDYARLAEWWISQIGDLHLYIGHGLYRADRSTFSGSGRFSAEEVPNQIDFNRDYWGAIWGSVFFRAENITRYSSGNFVEQVQNDQFRYPALTPPMPWKDQTMPEAPTHLDVSWDGDQATLTWVADPDTPRFAVYRVLSATTPDPSVVARDARNLLGVTGRMTFVDRPGIAQDDWWYFVRGVSKNSIESAPSPLISLQGRATSIESQPIPEGPALSIYPTPFADQTRIAFTLNETAIVTVHIIDALGRSIQKLIRDRSLAPGPHEALWTAGERLADGVYFVVLEVDGQRISSPVLLAH